MPRTKEVEEELEKLQAELDRRHPGRFSVREKHGDVRIIRVRKPDEIIGEVHRVNSMDDVPF